MATLTTVKGANLTNLEAVPSVVAAANQSYGRLRIMYDKYVVDTADEFGTSGLIRMMTIPQQARLIDAKAVCAESASTGIFEIGWAASTDGVETADANGIMTIDPGAGAVASFMLGTEAGYGKTFSSPVEVQWDCTEASADLGAETLHLTLFLSVD